MVGDHFRGALVSMVFARAAQLKLVSVKQPVSRPLLFLVLRFRCLVSLECIVHDERPEWIQG